MKMFKQRKYSPPLLAMQNSILGTITCIILTLLGATLIDSGIFNPEQEGYIAKVIIAISTSVGCLLTVFKVKTKKFPYTMLTSAGILALLCLGNLIVSDGSFRQLVPVMLTVFSTAAVCCILGCIPKRQSYR